MSRRVFAAGAVVAAGVAVTVLVGAGVGATTARTPRARPAAERQPAPAIPDAAEVVTGTLTAPPSSSFLARVRAGRMGGVILLGNGWLTRSVAASVTAQLQQAACTRGEPLLIATDQEGGIVKRLDWAPPTEAPAEMGSPGDARAQATETAHALRSVGIDVDFAPVVDTPSSPANFLGSRAFSRSRWWNARMARAFVTGLQAQGIAATAKHFPGLGLAGGNTDNGRIVIGSAGSRIRRGLVPFRSAVRAGIQLVMVSTAIYPKLDPSRRPAAFSRRILQGLLRTELGFEGVTVTDSLTAPAAVAIPHAATRAMLAGSDLLIWGSEGAAVDGYKTIAADAAGSSRLRARLAQAAGRIRALKSWLAAHGGATCS